MEDKKEKKLHTTVHEVRKSCKKIRGLLSLVRDVLPDYHSENHFFRDEARKISDLRDSKALIEALEICYVQYGHKLYKDACDDLRSACCVTVEMWWIPSWLKKISFRKIKSHMLEKCNAIPTIEIEMDCYMEIRPSIKRVYKRGRKAFNTAQNTESPKISMNGENA